MGTKVAVAFANIFMAKVETELLKKERNKAYLLEKIYRRHLLSLGYRKRTNNTEQENNHHATIKFTAEISEEKARAPNENIVQNYLNIALLNVF